MTDLSITAANVLAGASAITENGTFGATVTQGQVVYKDPADSEYKPADSDGASATVKAARGIALNAGADGQPGAILKEGPITIGATLTPGARYYLSDTPGGIIPEADLAAPMDVVLIGYAQDASVLVVDFKLTGVTLS